MSEYVLIDTAGKRHCRKTSMNVVKFSVVVKTLKAIEDANVVLPLIDARDNIISDQDLKGCWWC